MCSSPRWSQTRGLGAYLVFMALNIVGVHIAATFELVVTLLAVGELLVFMGVVWPAFSFRISRQAAGPGRIISAWRAGGIFAALPFAIWFFLAIEGVAMAAEEAKEPRRTIPIAYITGILTLTVLAFGVMVFAGGSGDWRSLANLNDPLPQAMKRAVGASSGWLHMLVWLGPVRAGGQPRHHHGLCAADLRAGARGYLPAAFCRCTRAFAAYRHAGGRWWASPPSTAIRWCRSRASR
jgi:ethanolamine permease